MNNKLYHIRFPIILLQILFLLSFNSCSRESVKERATDKTSNKPKMSPQYENLLTEGMDLLNQYKRKEAIELFNKAINLEPTQPFAYNNRGLAYYGEGKIDQAIADYNKSIKLDPNYILPILNKGNAFSRKKRYKDALVCFKLTLEKDDGKLKFVTRINIAKTLMYMGKYDEAIMEINSAQKEEPYSPYTFLANGTRGMILYHKNDYKKAIIEFNKSSTNFTEIKYYLGMCYEKLNKKDVALEHYKKALLISKKFPLLQEMREEIVKHIKRLNKELEGK